MTKACCTCGTQDGQERIRQMCPKCYYAWYYQQNKDKYIKRADEWKEENKKRYREIHRDASRRRRAKMTQEEKWETSRRSEISRKKNMTDAVREQRRENSRQYYQKMKNDPRFKEQRKLAKQKRRARKRNLVADLTKEQWQSILESYQYRCAYCGKKFDSLTQDHVIPVAKSGDYTMHNIVPACLKCNQRKNDDAPPIPVQPVLI